MTSQNGTATVSYIEGTVEAVSERGLKLHGEWVNKSNFGHVVLPPQGTSVRVQLDGRGFIKALEILGASPTTNSRTSERDRTITKLAVLKAAAGFVGQLATVREDVKSEHVLLIADRWLAWVDHD